MGVAERSFVTFQNIPGAGWPVPRVGGGGHRTATPLGAFEEVEPRAIARVQPDEQAAAIGHFPPERRRAWEGDAAAVLVDTREEQMHAAIEQRQGGGAGESVNVVLDGHRGPRFFPQILGQPVEHRLPLGGVHKRGVVARERGDFQLARAQGFQKLRAPRGRGDGPPIGHRHGRFGGPAKPPFGGAARRIQDGVHRDIQIAPV